MPVVVLKAPSHWCLNHRFMASGFSLSLIKDLVLFWLVPLDWSRQRKMRNGTFFGVYTFPSLHTLSGLTLVVVTFASHWPLWVTIRDSWRQLLAFRTSFQDLCPRKSLGQVVIPLSLFGLSELISVAALE